jgi:hypothetical protein
MELLRDPSANQDEQTIYQTDEGRRRVITRLVTKSDKRMAWTGNPTRRRFIARKK